MVSTYSTCGDMIGICCHVWCVNMLNFHRRWHGHSMFTYVVTWFYYISICGVLIMICSYEINGNNVFQMRQHGNNIYYLYGSMAITFSIARTPSNSLLIHGRTLTGL